MWCGVVWCGVVCGVVWCGVGCPRQPVTFVGQIKKINDSSSRDVWELDTSKIFSLGQLHQKLLGGAHHNLHSAKVCTIFMTS